ncbi:non-ribosomal peptide synthetase [Xenorhabdus innexi]|uniref:Amino acid adenylation n=1 Tax=Xenorhabdus innexi TaxID=290109 RepID=A0A1N6MWH0_9GAMM|nr:non-ribosomal peptide synthetase [Xenorhabdus innexi]PHM36580.1 Amino acid adenylation [Xenorhabdus innexi]SIP73127.1 Non-ribosomal peptide synthetase [Xenorhabdus innexi]
MTRTTMNLDDLKRAVLEKRLEEQLKSRGYQQQQSVIKPADRNQPLPLSFAQQRLWFLCQFEPAASLAYHLPVILRLSGQLNRYALTVSLNRLVARHESLRTRFVSVEGKPCQHIDPADIGCTLSYHDLSQSDPALHSQRITEFIDTEAQTPFDFTQERLIRTKLLRLSDNEHILLLTLHHIITDGWSTGVLVRELGEFYRAALDGHDIALPPLPVQYADYAVWLHDQSQGNNLAKQRDFWNEQLRNAPPLLTLPTDRVRPAVQSYTGGKVSFHLESTLLASLKELGKRHNSTLFMTMLTAWSIVLSRLSGQDDIIIGTPVANRPHHELEGLIGFFVNTLALRVTFSNDMSVADLLTQIRQRSLAAYAHQDLPFEQVVEVLQPERSLSYSPIFQVMMALNNTPAQEFTLPGLQLTPIEQERRGAHFDLTLSLNEIETGLAGDLEYAADLFDHSTVERMVVYLTNVLTEMADDVSQPVNTLPMLPDSERQQLLVNFNATHDDFPREALIHQLFEAQVLQRPDAIAVSYEGRTLSYRELNCHANRLAHHLLALGIRPDEPVAICAERSPELIIGLLAILKAGGAYLPLDPNYPAERLRYMLEDARPAALLTQTAWSDKLDTFMPVVLLDNLLNEQETPLAAYSTRNLDVQASGLTSHNLAYIIYTSGSTGQPKGVMVEHRNVLHLVINNHFSDITPDDCIAHCANISFDAATWEVWSALVHGARLQLIAENTLLQPKRFSDFLLSEGVTALFLTTSLFSQYANLIAPVLSGLRYLLFGGEQADPLAAIRLRATYPPRYLLNMYGPTETTTFATAYEIPFTKTGSAESEIKIPIGSPTANTQIYILDQHRQPVPFGVTGEIYIAGEGVSRGYLNRPDLTAERFRPDPFSSMPDARMYKTGDLGRWLPDGNIDYLGRNDFQVKIRGFRIELGEIEKRLSQCDGVQKALVLAREEAGDKETGSQKRLIAYIQPLPDMKPEPTELRQQLARHLADYMLPSAFVMLDNFPLTSNGKTDRDALPAPDASAFVARVYESPTGQTETALAQIWQKLLGVEQIGRHDHFFELGGHSLMIVSLIEELRCIGWSLDIRNVFSTPVLAEMAQALRRGTDSFVVPENLIPENCAAIVPEMLPLVTLSQAQIDAITETVSGGAGNVQDIYPLSPLQEGILFHHLMQAQGDTYLLQSLLVFDSRERLDNFLAALQQVINRHDILRTSLFWQGLEHPVQVVWRQAPLAINLFTPTSDENIQAQLLAHTDPRQHRMELTRAPLFTADIAHDMTQNEWLLVLRFHHLVSDHVTLELIFAEIGLLLQEKTALPAVLPYRNFIARTLSVPLSEHEDYFRTRLADIDAPTAPFGILSISKPSMPDNEPEAEQHEARLSLSPALSGAIRALSRELKINPSILFHVAWAQVLAYTSNRDNVVFGSVLSGRLQGGAGADQILGMFINTLPVRVSLADRSVHTVVQETYQDLITLLEHEQAPLTLAQSCSGVDHSIPLFSTLLNYRHSQVSEAETTDNSWSGMRVIAAKEGTNYPITLSVDDLGTDFRLSAHTVTGIDPVRITRYLQTALSGLVDALTHQPQQLILHVPILPEAERQQLLVTFNATQTDFPQDRLIHQLFEAQVLQRSDAVALTYEDQTVSYEELNQRANRLAHYLITLGVRPDDRVAICAERSPELIVSLLAILKAGGAYVPLDPAYPTERLTFMLEDATPVVLLAQSALLDKLPDTVPVFVLDAADTSLSTQPADNPDTQALGLTSRNLAYVLYTSGSTGQPKGVMVEHIGVNRLVINNHYADINVNDCVAHCANTAFDASTWEIWSALLNGGRLHIVSQSVLLDPPRFRDALISGKVTALWLTAGLFNEYLNTLRPLFGQLRYLLVGGDVLDPIKIQQVQLAESRPVHLINGYGPTETTTFAATYEIASPVDAAQTIPIGRPIANTRIYILNSRGQPVPVGVAGEIYIAGNGVARGYLNNPELTAERFMADPFSAVPASRMYKTGDLGCWRSDGNIEYLGRNDSQIKLRGFRIEPGEIETRLTQCHGVREAVVLSRADSSGQKQLVAYLLTQSGAELNPAELRQQLSLHLADYMLPSAFITLETFPLTPNGKLDRQALPAPDISAVVAHQYEAPNGEEEEILAQIWQSLLGLERVGRHDNFFELGGHSLMVGQLATRIQHEFLIDIPIASLFLSPRLADQAEIIFTAQREAVGQSDIESLEDSLDSMSAEELMAMLGGEGDK